MVLSNISINERPLTRFVFERAFISSLSSFCNTSRAIFLCFISFNSSIKSSERMDMSGFFIPAASKMSMTCSVTRALSITWRIVVAISSLVLPASFVSNFTNRAFTAWKKATSSFTSIAWSCGMAIAKALERAVTSLMKRFLPFSILKMCSSASRIRPSLRDVSAAKYSSYGNPCNMAEIISSFSCIN